MSQTIIMEDYNVRLNIGNSYIRFLDLEEEELERKSYYVSVTKAEKLSSATNISLLEASLLLGKIQQIFISCLEFNQPDRRCKCANSRKIQKIPEELLISTLCNLLEVISFQELYAKIGNMKYYQIEDLCNSLNPMRILENF